MFKNVMVPLLAALVLSVCFYSYSSAQQTGPNNSTRLNTPGSNTIADDRYVEVPLQFIFPFYGEDFDSSWMYDNGVLGFRDPSQTGNAQRGGYGYFCCNPRDIQAQIQNGTTQNMDVYSFAIYGLWTDLIDLQVDLDGDGVVDSGYFTEGDTTYQRYYWQNIAEYYNSTRLNSFDITIRPDGSYNINFGSVDVRGHGVASGVAGDLSNVNSSTTYDPSIHGVEHFLNTGGYRTAISGALDTVNNYASFCAANSLYDPTCPNYAQALATQQYNQACTSDPLYDAGCTGYDTAYLDLQCSADDLYDPACPGYVEAYYDQQCTLDPTYDTGCAGYEEAYFNEQCNLDPQYDTGCPGYVEPFDYTAYEEETAEVEVIELPTIYEDPVIELAPMPEPVQQTGEESNLTDTATFVEDDIEPEIAELEAEADQFEEELVIEELAEIETEEGENGTGETAMEDDIEEELARLEDEAEGADEETEVQVADQDFGPDGVGTPDIVEERSGSPEREVDTITAEDKAESRKQKMKELLAKKAIELTEKIEKAATIEQQMIVQRQLLAIAAFVPDFDYDEKTPIDLANFYDQKPVVDHQYARWFLNDPNFGLMEDQQYPSLRRN